MDKKNQITLLIVAGVCMWVSACTNRTVLHEFSSQTSLPKPHITVWFVKSKKDELKVVPVTRVLLPGNRLEVAIRELLQGPTADEIDSGLGTEIPRGTILLSVKEHGQNVDLNLSHRFATGGGSTSFETRLSQLSKTIESVSTRKKVYLNIEGKRLSETPGEGLEVKQPIN